jgi:phospholipase/carboxylesterase
MAHGSSDGVLPIALGQESRDVLSGMGFTVEWHEYPMAHSVCAAEVADLREFLLRVLPNVTIS